jgi:hypothetical protein
MPRPVLISKALSTPSQEDGELEAGEAADRSPEKSVYIGGNPPMRDSGKSQRLSQPEAAAGGSVEALFAGCVSVMPPL